MKKIATAALLTILACAPALAQGSNFNQGFGNQVGNGSRCGGHHRRHHGHRNHGNTLNGRNGQFNR